MFSVLGKLVVRFWPIVLAAWGVALVLCWLLAPAWDTVADLSEVASLPADTPSRHADQLLQEAFPENFAGSSIVLVAWRDASALNKADRKFVERVVAPRLARSRRKARKVSRWSRAFAPWRIRARVLCSSAATSRPP